MRYFVLVDIVHPRENLQQEGSSISILDFVQLDDMVKELPTIRVLHDEVKRSRGFYYLVKLDNVLMAHCLEDVDFPGYTLQVRLLFDLILFQDLNRNLL